MTDLLEKVQEFASQLNRNADDSRVSYIVKPHNLYIEDNEDHLKLTRVEYQIVFTKRPNSLWPCSWLNKEVAFSASIFSDTSSGVEKFTGDPSVINYVGKKFSKIRKEFAKLHQQEFNYKTIIV